MTTLAELRAQNPGVYDHIEDRELADAIYNRYYSGANRQEYDAQIGLTPYAGPVEAFFGPALGFGSAVQDTVNNAERMLSEGDRLDPDAARDKFDPDFSFGDAATPGGPIYISPETNLSSTNLVSDADQQIIRWGRQKLGLPLEGDTTPEQLAQIQELVRDPAEKESFDQFILGGRENTGKMSPEEAATVDLRYRLNAANIERGRWGPNVRPNSWESAIAGATGSFTQQAPAIIAGLLLARAGNKAAGASIIFGQIGAQTGLQAYNTGREAGLEPKDAMNYAGLQTAAELVPSMIPVGILLKEGMGVAARVAGSTVAEGGQEFITALLQAAVDKGTISPDMTFEEAWPAILNQTASGHIGGFLMGALGAGAHSLMGKFGAKEPTPDEISNNIFPIVRDAPENDTTGLPLGIEDQTGEPQLLLASPVEQPPYPRSDGGLNATVDPAVVTQEQQDEDDMAQARIALQRTRQTETSELLQTARETIRPLGTFTREEIGGAAAQRVGAWRLHSGRNIDGPITIEDMARAKVPQDTIDGLIAGRRPMTYRVAITPADVKATADAHGLIFDDSNFKTLALRATGSRNVNLMSQAQLNALNTTLESMPVHAKPVTIPVADVSPFTETQYNKALDALRAAGRYTFQTLKDATGIKNQKDATALRDTLVRRGQLTKQGDKDYRLYDVIGEERQAVPDDMPVGAFNEHVVKKLPVKRVRVTVDGKSVGTFGSATAARNKASELATKNTENGGKSSVKIEPAEEVAYGVMENRYDEKGNFLGQVAVDSSRDEATARKKADELNAGPQRPDYIVTPVEPTGLGNKPDTPVKKRKKLPPEGLRGRLDEVLAALKKRSDEIGLSLLGTPVKTKLVNRVQGPDGPDDVAEGMYLDNLISITVDHIAAGNATEGMTTATVIDMLMQVMDHEVIHALRKAGILGPNTAGWKTLVKYIAKAKQPGTNETYLAYAKSRYTGKPGYDAEAIQEEAIAEAFRHWAKDRRAVVGKPATVFRQLVNWFKSLSQSIPTEIFKSIDSGAAVWNSNMASAFKVDPPSNDNRRAAAARKMAESRLAATEADVKKDKAGVQSAVRSFIRARAQGREDRYGRSGPKSVVGTTPTAEFENGDKADVGFVDSILAKFRKAAGISAAPLRAYLIEDTDYMKRVADAQERAVHDPKDNAVVKAYRSLIAETRTMFDALGPIEITQWKEDGAPYENQAAMFADIEAGKLRMRLSDDMFGESVDNAGHPMNEPSGRKTADGAVLTNNDLLRITHEVFGRGPMGLTGSTRDGYNAYHEHARLLSDEARKALATETLAQNAWHNFGPQMRRGDGTVPRTTDEDHLTENRREFAEQKAFLLPDTLIEADPGLATAEEAAIAEDADEAQFSVGSEAFQKFFSGSKAVTPSGRPLSLYHGTRAKKIEAFIAKAAASRRTTEGDAALAFFFSNKHDVARGYAEPADFIERTTDRLGLTSPRVEHVYLAAKNPFEMDMAGKDYDERVFTDTINAAKEAGHDSVVFRNVVDTGFTDSETSSDVWAVFQSTQIKSVDNRGTWDGNDPRIRHSVGSDQFKDSLPGGRLYGNPNRSIGGVISAPNTKSPAFTTSNRPSNQLFGGEMADHQLRMTQMGTDGAALIYMSPEDFLSIADNPKFSLGVTPPPPKTATDSLTMNAEKGERVTDEGTLTRNERAHIRTLAEKIQLNATTAMNAVKRIMGANPESDGWKRLWLSEIKPKTSAGKTTYDYEFKKEPYDFDRDPATGAILDMGSPEYKTRVSALGSSMVDELKDVIRRADAGDKNAQNILEHAGWYRDFRVALRQQFGGLGDLFADLLGATSPNTPVRDNWANAVQALQRALNGDFDTIIPALADHYTEVARLEADLMALVAEKLASTTRTAPGPVSLDGKLAAIKRSDEYQKIWVPLRELRKQVKKVESGLVPLKKNDKKYGFNSAHVGVALAQLWRTIQQKNDAISRGGQKPKALNFSGNLIGITNRATIDVWAARMLQRLAGFARLPVRMEQAVGGNMNSDGTTTGQFRFGQDVMENATDKVLADPTLSEHETLQDLNPDDMQAIVWFIEKEIWARNNWSNEEGGSFELEAALAGSPKQALIRMLRKLTSAKDTQENARAKARGELVLLNAPPDTREVTKRIAALRKIRKSKQTSMTRGELAALEDVVDGPVRKARIQRMLDVIARPDPKAAAKIAGQKQLAKLEGTLNRFVAGISADKSEFTQGYDHTSSDPEMSRLANAIRRVIYGSDPDGNVIAGKAASSEGWYGPDHERSLDIEVVARHGWNPMKLWQEMVEIGQREEQDAVFLSRVIRAEEQFDPLKHRPGVEVYFNGPKGRTELARYMEELESQGVEFMTVVVDPVRTTASQAGEMPAAVGVRMQYVPEFDDSARWLATATDAEIAAHIEAQAEAMAVMADAIVSKVEGVTFAQQLWYDTEVAFKTDYEGTLNAITTKLSGKNTGEAGGGQVWEGQSVQAGSARSNSHAQAKRESAERSDGSLLDPDAQGQVAQEAPQETPRDNVRPDTQADYDAAANAGRKFSLMPSLVLDGYAGRVRVSDSDGVPVARALSGKGTGRIPVVVYPKSKKNMGQVTAMESGSKRVPWPADGTQENYPEIRGATAVTKEDLDIRVDNPGGAWLEGQRADARSSTSGFSGAITAAVRMKNGSWPLLPTGMLMEFGGAMGEETAIPGSDYSQNNIEALRADMEESGYSLANPVMVWVGYDGTTKIGEGNHRIRAAQQAGIEVVPVDIRYFAGGESAEGPLNIKKVSSVLRKPDMPKYSLNSPTPPAGPPVDPFNVVVQRVDGFIGRTLHAIGRSKTRLPLIGSIFGFRTKWYDDKNLAIKEMLENLSRDGGTINNENNVYLQEELTAGQTVYQIEERGRRLLQPLFEALKDAHNRLNITVPDFEAYLYARHAPERNRHLRSRGSKAADPSGMSDAKATSILDKFATEGKLPDMERLAALADAIMADTTQTRVKSGLISAKAAASSPYQYYVPLRGFEETLDGDETIPHARPGKGYMIGGKREDNAVLGRDSLAGDLIGHMIIQNTEAVIRSEKNRVALSFMKLLQENVGKGIGRILQNAPIIQVVGSNGMIRDAVDPNYRKRDGTNGKPAIFTAKLNGKEIAMEVDDQRVARALRADYETTNAEWINVLGEVNRYLATVNTALNPEFLLTNMVRDVQTAGILAAQYEIKGFSTRIVKGAGAAALGIREVLRDGTATTPMALAFRELQKAGGTTEFLGIHDLDTHKASLRFDATSIGLKATPRQALEHVKNVGKFVSDYNKVAENALRLSAFVEARKLGASLDSAASLAKNLTVNFNRGAENKALMNSLYLFYNVGAVGNSLILKGLKNREVQKIVGLMAASAFALDVINRMMSDDDDDNGVKDYDDIPDYILENNWVFMIPGQRNYISVPLPYGFNVFHNLGRNISNAMSGSPAHNPWKSATSIVMTALNTYSPMGRANNILNFFFPTVADPIVDMYLNKDFANNDIVPERPTFGLPTPNSEKYWSNIGEVPKWTAERVNAISGGNETRTGGLSVSPETLQYVFDYVTGAVGQTTRRIGKLTMDTVTGNFQDIELNDIPFARRMVGTVTNRGNTERYYENAREVATVAAEMEVAQEQGDANRELRLINEKGPQIEMIPDFKDAADRLSDLRADIREARANRDLSDRARRGLIKLYQEEQDAIMAATNRLYFGLNR
jgi:hypothetical protein